MKTIDVSILVLLDVGRKQPKIGSFVDDTEKYHLKSTPILGYFNDYFYTFRGIFTYNYIIEISVTG